MKRLLLGFLALAVAAAPLARAQSRRAPQAPASMPPFSIVEATIPEMRAAMDARRITSRELVRQCLVRIATYEERLNAAIAVSPRALEEAEALDRERAEGRLRGPLHGIPIALKDNIHTTSMPTTGGALAFEGLVPPYEATLVKHLRDAGAVIIAKTVMTELANWVATGMPGNYSALGGYGMNPYDPRRDPREASGDGRPVMGTGGSSSGIGTAASFWAASVGTETSGSILSPSNATMLVGIKPTVGRISRHGVIPITADQDTAGPMTRSVADAAALPTRDMGRQPLGIIIFAAVERAGVGEAVVFGRIVLVHVFADDGGFITGVDQLLGQGVLGVQRLAPANGHADHAGGGRGLAQQKRAPRGDARRAWR
ncbi:MAG TPA: amidase family protein, partial [Vicinamibacterales bacterium]|nr:amidase family protein [Vicinamibacterales bacterium]